ncbi:MAG: tetratricopeptide repeat protein [Gammaproteobacteria bacterium]|nr:tetratricopeptide repeat protein [Gammaproteobacteria bacterium]
MRFRSETAFASMFMGWRKNGTRVGASVLSLLLTCVGVFSAVDADAASGLNRKPGWPGNTLGGLPCYGVADNTRFDYITERDRLAIVENYHFYREVQELKQTDKQLASNLDYTLRSIPNHHRALWLKVRHYLRVIKNEQARKDLAAQELIKEGLPPPECYFQRGKAFNPGDGMVPAIFAIYLHKRKQYDAALAEYELAEQLLPNYAEVVYNKGLLYFDMGELDKAREYAERARALGYPLTGLQRKLDDSASADTKSRRGAAAPDAN